MAEKPPHSKAQMLLLEYRPAIWRKAAHESISGTVNKVLQDCTEQIQLTNKLVEALQGNKLLGDKLYWIIYVSYMTKRQPNDVEEILTEIALKYRHIPRRTYFRLRRRAIRMMNDLLNHMA